MKPPLTFWERLWILGAILAVLMLIGALIATYGGGGGEGGSDPPRPARTG